MSPRLYAKRYCSAQVYLGMIVCMYTQLLFLMQLTERRGSRFSLSLDGGCHRPHSSCRRGLFSISGCIKNRISRLHHLQSRLIATDARRLLDRQRNPFVVAATVTDSGIFNRGFDWYHLCFAYYRIGGSVDRLRTAELIACNIFFLL